MAPFPPRAARGDTAPARSLAERSGLAALTGRSVCLRCWNAGPLAGSGLEDAGRAAAFTLASATSSEDESDCNWAELVGTCLTGLVNCCFPDCLRFAAPLIRMPGASSNSFSSIASLLESLSFGAACFLRFAAIASSLAALYSVSVLTFNDNDVEASDRHCLLEPFSLRHSSFVAIFLLLFQSLDSGLEFVDIKRLVKTLLLSCQSLRPLF